MVFDRIDKGLKPWQVIAFVVIAVGLGAILGLSTGSHLRDLLPAGVDILDMRFLGYSYEEAVELLVALGSDGRSYYATSQLLTDIVFIPFAFLAVASVFLWLTRPGQKFSVPLSEGIRVVVIAIAFTAMLSDFVENISILVMLGSGEDPANGVVALASTIAGIKWLAYAGSWAALAATVIVAVVRGTSSQQATA